MPPVETARVTAQQSTHHCGNRCISRSQQQVEMVGYQRPCVTMRPGFSQNRFKPIEKIIPVKICPKDFPPLNSPANDMVQCTSGINASLAWHVPSISCKFLTYNSCFHTRPESAGKTGKVSWMKEPYGEGVASHTGPESCGGSSNAAAEALTGVRAGQVLSREILLKIRVST